MLHYELDQLSTPFTRGALVQEPGRTAHRLVEQGYDWLFVKERPAGLDTRRLGAGQRRQPSHDQGFPPLHRLGLRERGELPDRGGLHDAGFPRAAAGALCLTLPLFLMAAFVGLVDGLVCRDIRRFGAGRESGFIYHRARASLIPLAVLPWVRRYPRRCGCGCGRPSGIAVCSATWA
jgi:hypothetical protein